MQPHTHTRLPADDGVGARHQDEVLPLLPWYAIWSEGYGRVWHPVCLWGLGVGFGVVSIETWAENVRVHGCSCFLHFVFRFLAIQTDQRSSASHTMGVGMKKWHEHHQSIHINHGVSIKVTISKSSQNNRRRGAIHQRLRPQKGAQGPNNYMADAVAKVPAAGTITASSNWRRSYTLPSQLAGRSLASSRASMRT